MKKAKGCMFGLVLGSVLRALFFLLNQLAKAIAIVMAFFGLWIPFIYALFGAILYVAYGFNPFDENLDSMLYLAGFALTLVGALIITIRNLIIKPSKSVVEGFKTPIWQRAKDEEDIDKGEIPQVPNRWRHKEELETTSDKGCTRVTNRRTTGRKSPQTRHQDNSATIEQPKVYYSVRERDTLIHEYSDRFEVYRIIDDKPYLDKVEYKNYGY